MALGWSAEIAKCKAVLCNYVRFTVFCLGSWQRGILLSWLIWNGHWTLLDTIVICQYLPPAEQIGMWTSVRPASSDPIQGSCGASTTWRETQAISKVSLFWSWFHFRVPQRFDFQMLLQLLPKGICWLFAVFIAEYSSEQSAALPLRLAKGLAQKWCMGTAKKWHAQPGDTLWSSLEMQFLHGNNQELNGLNHGKTWFKRCFSCSFAKWMWPLLSRLAMERDCLFFECSQRAWKTKAGALQCWCLKDSFDPTQVRFEQQWPATQALMMMMMWCNHLSLCIYIYMVQACNPPTPPPPPCDGDGS